MLTGYGTAVDLDVIRAWWSLHSLQGARWLVEHGFEPNSPGCEIDILRTQAFASLTHSGTGYAWA